MPRISGAKGTPDPTITYKFVLDLTSVSPAPDAVNPGLIAVARLVNTFAQYGVSAEHRRFVLVFHDVATEFVVNEATYRQRNGGKVNPNRALMESLSKAGVEFVVGGESVQARSIDPATIQPGVQRNLSTTLTFLDLETRGYVFSSTSKL